MQQANVTPYSSSCAHLVQAPTLQIPVLYVN